MPKFLSSRKLICFVVFFAVVEAINGWFIPHAEAGRTRIVKHVGIGDLSDKVNNDNASFYDCKFTRLKDILGLNDRCRRIIGENSGYALNGVKRFQFFVKVNMANIKMPLVSWHHQLDFGFNSRGLAAINKGGYDFNGLADLKGGHVKIFWADPGPLIQARSSESGIEGGFALYKIATRGFGNTLSGFGKFFSIVGLRLHQRAIPPAVL